MAKITAAKVRATLRKMGISAPKYERSKVIRGYISLAYGGQGATVREGDGGFWIVLVTGERTEKKPLQEAMAEVVRDMATELGLKENLPPPKLAGTFFYVKG